jgi:protein dithiol oxidoreductase (disulfide-forming)
MKRREFTQAVAGTALASSALLSSYAYGQRTNPVPGTQFNVIEPRAPVEAPADKVEVVEFFWYSCSHCNAFEPTLEAWVKKLPKDVVFKRVPIAFQASHVPQQRLFYALEAMGLVEKLHTKVFAAIHVERANLATGEAITEWVARQGVDRAKFVEQYNSFSVVTKSGKGTQLQNAYKVEGVPALGVAGRFYTDGSKAGNMERALQVVEYLIEQARRSGR